MTRRQRWWVYFVLLFGAVIFSDVLGGVVSIFLLIAMLYLIQKGVRTVNAPSNESEIVEDVEVDAP